MAKAPAEEIAAVAKRLFQPELGLYFAPIRHHSPACAWAVRALIREVKPQHVLIEAPADFAPHIDLLTHPETKPPVAIVVIAGEDASRHLAAYYPFCTHAPELVALKEAHALGAAVRFIDLPSAAKLSLREPRDGTPIPLTSETGFGSGDFIEALCHRTGCRDGYELWDHLFETRLGTADWRGLLADVGAYCAGIRAATPLEEIERGGEHEREAHMSAGVVEAMAEGGPIVVITGGFHTPALIEAAARKGRHRAPAQGGKSRSFLIRYSFAALDALNGYGAGLPQPAYYDFLWRQAEGQGGELVWRKTALDIASGFAQRMRQQGHAIALPQQVEMVRVAETLAQMRGRPGALRHDLIDAARTALIKGEAGRRDIWTERLIDYLRGEAIGDIPASAGSPPLVEHARAQARAHRIDIGDGTRRRRRLDIRRTPAHLTVSRYFHAMDLLGTGFAVREAGPDYLNGTQTELLFEEWSYAWSPVVEGKLIELAPRADRLDAACLSVLASRRDALKKAGASAGIAAFAELIGQGILAGLGRELAPFVDELSGSLLAHADFPAVAHTLRRLYYMSHSNGPLRAPESLGLQGAAGAAYRRLIHLCGELPETQAEHIGTRLEALRIVTELLKAGVAQVFDRELFDESIDRVAGANPPPAILGAVLAICVQTGRRQPEHLIAALAGQFAGAVIKEEDRVGVLTGFLQTAPQLLWDAPGIIEEIDRFLDGLDEEAFLALLPHLRLAFTALNPREVDRVAELLSRLHGTPQSAFAGVQHALSEAALQQGLALEQNIRTAAKRDGLSAWLFGEVS
ncbi:MAG: DUF5682 family protein [Rhodomicrobium sp.]